MRYGKKPKKIDIARMALVMANGDVCKAKEYAKGERISARTWAKVIDERYREENTCTSRQVPIEGNVKVPKE